MAVVLIMDVSKYFIGLIKSQGPTFGKSLNPESKTQRVESMNQQRKFNRHDLLMAKRNISSISFDDSQNFNQSGINLKEKKRILKLDKPKEMSRRDRLDKWKKEKELRKKDELGKKQPIFKVCRSVGLPNVDEAISLIKGKKLDSANKTKLSNTLHVPKNYVFVPPKNIQPICFNNPINFTKSSEKRTTTVSNAHISTRVTRSQTRECGFKAKVPSVFPLDRKSKAKQVPSSSSSSVARVIRPMIATKGNGSVKEDIKLRSKSIEAVKRSIKQVTPKKKPSRRSKSASAQGDSATLIRDDKSLKAAKSVIDLNLVDTQAPGIKIDIMRKANKTKKNATIAQVKDEIIDLSTPSPQKLRKIQSTSHPKKNGTSTEKKVTKHRSNRRSKSLSDKPDMQKVGEHTPLAYNSSNIKSADTPVTPKNKGDLLVYVSPFVTVSRGKSSARKEYHDRRSDEAHTLSPNLNESTGPKAGAAYFRRLLDKEIERLFPICDSWDKYKNESKLPDGACDMIDVTIGQCKLLIRKKFEQFRGLINNCESNDGDMPITCEDLHGFWDMVYMQVKNVDSRFQNLENLKDNNWEEILPESKPIAPIKKRGRPPMKKSTVTKVKSSLKDTIKAAREKAKLGNNLLQVPEEMMTFDGGFFKVQSPQKHTYRTPRKSLLSVVLDNHTIKRKSSGIAMLEATHSAKKAQTPLPEKTPGKSILKGVKPKSSIKKNKSVLFKDEFEGKENEETMFNIIDLNTPKELDLSRKSSTYSRNKLF